MTLSEAKNRYVAALRGFKADNTVKAYSGAIDRLIAYAGESPIESIGKEQIAGFRSALLSDGVSVNGAADYLNKLKVFFGWCVSQGFLKNSPIEAADVPKKRQIEYDLLSKEQIEQTITAGNRKVAGMSAKNAARNRAIILVLLCCGLRNSELRSLVVGDLDFDAGTITVRHGKGDKRRIAPFPAAARTAVAEYLKEQTLKTDEILFGSRADKHGHEQPDGELHEMSAAALENIVKGFLGATVGKSVKTHALRHAAASYWDDLGVGMRDVQIALGHSSIRTTEQVYVRVLNKGKSASAINAAFGS